MKPLFPRIGQISMIVDDVLAYAKRWNDDYGIGPWHFLHFTEENMTDMEVHGKAAEYAMDIALCNLYDIELELIAPQDDRSAYAEFLRKHGPGLHHLAVVTPEGSYRQLVNTLKEKGNQQIQKGADPIGQEFSYFDLNAQLGLIVELNDRPDDFHPLPPEECYPPRG